MDKLQENQPVKLLDNQTGRVMWPVKWSDCGNHALSAHYRIRLDKGGTVVCNVNDFHVLGEE